MSPPLSPPASRHADHQSSEKKHALLTVNSSILWLVSPLRHCCSEGNSSYLLRIHRRSILGERRADGFLSMLHTIGSIRSLQPFGSYPTSLSQDITTILLDPKAFKDTIDLFVERYKDKNINIIAGVEARGFIFGPSLHWLSDHNKFL